MAELDEISQEVQQQDPPNKAKILYDAVSKKYDVGTFDEFSNKLKDPSKRKAFYDGVGSEYDLGTFDEFESKVSPIKKKENALPFFGNTSKTTPSVSNPQSVSRNENLPIANDYGNGNLVASDPISLIKQAKELENKTKPLYGPGEGALVPDQDAIGMSNKIKEDLKTQGIDAEKLYEQVKDVPEELYSLPGFSKQELSKEQKDNPQRFSRKLATGKWQLNLRSDLNNLDIPDDQKTQIWRNVLKIQNESDLGDYNTRRQGVKDLTNIINQYGGENKDKLLQDLSVDRAKTYGESFMTGFSDLAKNDPNSQFLDNDELLGLQYLQDTNPEAAQGYNAALIDPKKIEGNLFAKQGLEEKKMRLKQLGANLQQSYIQEEINDLTKIKNEQGFLTPQQEQKAALLTLRDEQINEELTNANIKYGTPAVYDREAAVQEILGQKVGLGEYVFNKIGESTSNTVEGLKNLITYPFLNDPNSKINQLTASGENMTAESMSYLTEKNKALQDFEYKFSPSLQKKIDEIKNYKGAENSENDKLYREKAVYDLLRDNPNDWAKVPIKSGRLNLTPSTLFFSIGGLGAQLVPFMAMEAVTGGGATATMGRKLLSTFISAASTSFQDEYANAVRSGEANPFSHALRVTAINSAALAGAGTPDAIRAMLGTKTAIGELVSKMSNNDIEAMMKSKPTAIKNFAKSIGKSFGESTKSGAKITALTTTGNIANQLIDNKEIDYDKLAKQGLVTTLAFSFGGGVAGLKSKYDKIDNIQSDALVKSSEQPELFIDAAKEQLRNGAINTEQFNQIKSNIEKAAIVSKNVKFVDNNGNPLSPKNKAELLLLKMKEYDLNELVNGDVPEQLKQKTEEKLQDVKKDMEDVYKNKEQESNVPKQTVEEINKEGELLQGKQQVDKITEDKKQQADKEVDDFLRSKYPTYNEQLKQQGKPMVSFSDAKEVLKDKFKNEIDDINNKFKQKEDIPLGENVPPEIKETSGVSGSALKDGGGLSEDANKILGLHDNGANFDLFDNNKLRQIAKDNGIDLPEGAKNADIIEALKNKRNELANKNNETQDVNESIGTSDNTETILATAEKKGGIYAQLAKAVKNLLGGVKTTVYKNLSDFAKHIEEEVSTHGAYNENDKTIHINNETDKNKLHIFFHEALHHITISKIKEFEKNPNSKNLTPEEFQAISNLKRIFKQVSEKVNRDRGGFGTQKGGNTPKNIWMLGDRGTDRGFANVHEFISEAFSNPEFQKLLKDFKGEGKQPNLFKQFLDAVAKMLGLKDPTILDDIFHHTEKLIDKKEAPPQYTEAAGVSGSALKDVGKGEPLNTNEEAKLKELYKKSFLKQEMTPQEQQEFVDLKNKKNEFKRKQALDNQLEEGANVNGDWVSIHSGGYKKMGLFYSGENWEVNIQNRLNNNILTIRKRNPKTGELEIIHQSDHKTEQGAIEEYKKHNKGIEDEINARFDDKVEKPQAPTQYTEAAGVSGSALKDVDADGNYNKTQSDFLKSQKQELGSLYSDAMEGELKNEYYKGIEDVIKKGGKISFDVYNGLEKGQKYAFDKKYGADKIGDETLYHSTANDFEQFDLDKSGTKTDEGWFGRGIYFFKDQNDAKDFSLRDKNSKVKEAKVSLKNPLILSTEKLPKNVIDAFAKRGIDVSTIFDVQQFALKSKENPAKITDVFLAEGYDGLRLDLFPKKEVVVFNTSQIKPVEQPQAPTQYTEAAGGSALKDVESTTNALGEVSTKTNEKWFDTYGSIKGKTILNDLAENNLDYNPETNGFKETVGDEAYSKFKKQNQLENLNKRYVELNRDKLLSEAYHKAKLDGTNPELVKEIESLLIEEKSLSTKPETKVNEELPDTKVSIPSKKESLTEEGTNNVGGETETGEGGKEPPKGKVIEDDKGKTVGVHHEALTDLAKNMGLKEPERGVYFEPEQYAERGRRLLGAGGDPNEIDNTNNTLHDRISIGRAYLEHLTQVADEMGRKWGVDSKQFEDANKELNDYAGKVKSLGTEAHRAMTSLQGKREMDTDSFVTVKRAVSEYQNRPTSKEQDKKIKELTETNQKLKKQTDELEKQLIEATDKTIGEKSDTPKTVKEKAKDLADKFRKLKSKPFSFKDENGNEIPVHTKGVAWNDLVEFGAKVIEKTGDILQGVNSIIEKIKDTDWYKKLSDSDKKKLSEQLHEHYENALKPKGENELEILQNNYVDKKDNDFTTEEAKEIWDYAKKTYLDQGVSYRDMIGKVSNDLGLTWRQVSSAITTPKVKPISDEMWKKRGDYSRNQNATKKWVAMQNKTWLGKFWRGVMGAMRGAKVFGHSGIFFGTHAGMNFFNPSQWGKVMKGFVKGWQFAYGKNKANYERAMEAHKNSPNYLIAQRAGLKNNPDVINTEEYQKSQHFLGRIGLSGERGFNAIKVFRQSLFDNYYDKLSDTEKNDPESVASIAQLVNLATGATNLKIPEVVNEISFAGGMEAARWGKLTRSPMRATSTALKAMFTPDKVSAGEKVFAKIWGKRVGEQLATMVGLLAVNAAFQNIANPKNPTNLTDPNKPDWIKFKFGDMTLDPTSGMLGTFNFLKNISKTPFKSSKELHGDTRLQDLGKQVIGYARGKAAPGYSNLVDFATGTDYSGNVMPFSSDKPKEGKRKLTWGEYAAQSALPLPAAEAYTVTMQSAMDNGMTKPQLKDILRGIIAGGVSGTTGFRVSEYDAEKHNHSPFTEEDYKNIATFKKVKEDWGMELPNTVHTSEVITDEKNKTKKKLSEYPKEVQDKYDNLHKVNLDNELKDIFKTGKVYIKSYTNSRGEKISEVSLTKDKGGTLRKIDDLNESERAQILRIAQSQATKKTKQKIFGNKK